MSHTTAIKGLQIKDVSALRTTVAELQAAGVKCSLVENQRPRMYYEDQHTRAGEPRYGLNGSGVCAFVLKLDNSPYDVGFDLQADGTYTPIFDSFLGHIQKEIGIKSGAAYSMHGGEHDLARLLQGYAKNATINAAVAQGYSVDSCFVDDKGAVQLVLGVM